MNFVKLKWHHGLRLHFAGFPAVRGALSAITWLIAVRGGPNWNAPASDEITCRIDQVDLAAEKGSPCTWRAAEAGREVANLAASLNEMVLQFGIG